MATFLITGGTDGIGNGLALQLLTQGETVTIVGRNPQKGRRFLDEAARLGAADRAHFIPADLRLLSENRRVITEVTARSAALDGLVLCAQFGSSRRRETAEGFEQTFALYYLSRFALSHGLRGHLERATSPVIMNVCAPGTRIGTIHWDDLQLTRGYRFSRATFQGSRANDLLGVGFAQAHPDSAVRYVLHNPGGVATSFAGDLSGIHRLLTRVAARTSAPVETAVRPILATLRHPPAQPVSAFRGGTPLSLDHAAFDPASARRLYQLTTGLLAGEGVGGRR